MIIKWGEKVPKDFFLKWSSIGHKDDWATIICNKEGWWHAWEYPHEKDRLNECLEAVARLMELFRQSYKDDLISVTICQI